MGKKYHPTVSDQKASQRFQRQQQAQVRLSKSSVKPVTKPAKKK